MMSFAEYSINEKLQRKMTRNQYESRVKLLGRNLDQESDIVAKINILAEMNQLLFMLLLHGTK